MVEPTAADIKSSNERALRSLGRAISLSRGQFSVVLVCCNYRILQEQILQQLQNLSLGSIPRLTLPQNARSLYSAIHVQLRTDEQPAALHILGLESVEHIDDLLSSINQIRDEFPKRHPFPMIFWVNHEVLQKVVRFAPDFASWAATPIHFEMTTPQLQEFLRQETDALFAAIFPTQHPEHQNAKVVEHYPTLRQVWEHNNELHFAIKELRHRGITVEPELYASLEFVFGLDNYVSDRIYPALTHFQQSLLVWQKLTLEHLSKDETIPQTWNPELDIVTNQTSPPVRQGILLYYLGLCYSRLAEQNQTEIRFHWYEAKSYLQQSCHILQLAQRPDMVAEFISQLAEVLEHLEQWEELRTVAQKSLELHQTYGSQIQLACDYGFLAQVALRQSRWMQASILAQVSLLKLAEAQEYSASHQYLFPLLLAQIYYLVLAEAKQNLGEHQTANEYLDKAAKELSYALENSAHQYNAHRYIRMLRILRSLYFAAGRYLEAYTIRQKRRSIEQQYGFRAFIGAGRLRPQRQATNPSLMSPTDTSSVALEIAASGREQDIRNLIGRISRADQKLLVIHGQSGVGKSSTVSAGLVPALQHNPVSDQIAVPVVIRIYTEWVREFAKALRKAMLKIKGEEVIDVAAPDPTAPVSITDILAQLTANANNHLITVLIFDQFEEFFFTCTKPSQKQEFDRFLRDCLNISFVKIVFSLREDYLHRLLEFKNLSALEAVNHNILDKNIRYQLNNFSPEYAKVIIQKLTERSQMNLEPALIDALVEDLSAELGEVRPIELQVVGAQLQDERIHTLEQYQQFRPNKLIERYIRELIKDCGPENERAALLVLYLLTDETTQRPFKTRAELAAEIAELEDAGKLELILNILVSSGLVVLFPDVPERYQLIHDYLVDLIRLLQEQESSLQDKLEELRWKVDQSQLEIKLLQNELQQKKQQREITGIQPSQGLDLVTELRELRKREELSQLEIEQLRSVLKEKELTAQLAETQEKQRLSEAKLNRYLKGALSVAFLAILGLSISVVNVLDREIKTQSVYSEALFASQKGINALKESIKAGKKLQKAFWVDKHTKQLVQTALYQTVWGVREFNRLEGQHTGGVNSAIFSRDRTLIVSASADNTIKLWKYDGTFLETLSRHTDIVNSVTFSPDSQIIASGSQDKTVKLWNREGKLLHTLEGHTDVVNSVSFSQDGEILASASTDKTVKLWNREGKLLETLTGHRDTVLSVAWSPDSQTIASAGADGSIKLWNRNGKLLKFWTAHNDAIKSIAWSPNGQTIVSGSLDQTIKLWNLEGNLLKTLSGHTDGITSVSWSQDGNTIASASLDETIKLWSPQGLLLGTLRGHSSWVNSVGFSSDSRTLISAGLDKTVRLWRWDEVLRRNPKHDQEDWITSVSYSPDGKIIAAASRDRTVKLLNHKGQLLQTLKGHKGPVWGVAWSADGKILASVGKDKTVKLWSRDGKLLHTLTGHQDTILGVAWSADGRIASASKDKTVKLWSRDGKLLHTLEGHEDAVNWVDFSPDGQLLASASDDKTIILWSREGERLKTRQEHSRPVTGIAWSTDGKILASASIDSTVKLWSRDGQLQRDISGDGDNFTSVSFSPDGKTIVAASDDKIKLWNLEGTLLISLKGEKEELTSITFSPDGKTLAAGSGKGMVIFRTLTDIELNHLLTRGCNFLNNYLKTNPKVSENDRALCSQL